MFAQVVSIVPAFLVAASVMQAGLFPFSFRRRATVRIRLYSMNFHIIQLLCDTFNFRFCEYSYSGPYRLQPFLIVSPGAVKDAPIIAIRRATME